MSNSQVHFPDTDWPSKELPSGQPLSLHFNAINSPLLFGCRAGLCGTCLIELEATPDCAGPSEEEQEALEVYAPGNASARLACQVKTARIMHIRKL